jgi:hypothetical protein
LLLQLSVARLVVLRVGAVIAIVTFFIIFIRWNLPFSRVLVIVDGPGLLLLVFVVAGTLNLVFQSEVLLLLDLKLVLVRLHLKEDASVVIF